MLLVGVAAAGIAHHLQCARNLSEGRVVVLSGDERERGCVFKRAFRDRPVYWYLPGQLLKYEVKKMEGTIFRCFVSTDWTLNLLV